MIAAVKKGAMLKTCATILIALVIVIPAWADQPPTAPALQPPGITLQARVVRGVSEKPANQPEPWVIDAVKALQGQGGQQPPRFVEATMDWLPLSLDKPAKFDVRGMQVGISVQRNGQAFDIRLGLAQGNAQATMQLAVDSSPGPAKRSRCRAIWMASGGIWWFRCWRRGSPPSSPPSVLRS